MSNKLGRLLDTGYEPDFEKSSALAEQSDKPLVRKNHLWLLRTKGDLVTDVAGCLCRYRRFEEKKAPGRGFFCCQNLETCV